MEEKRNSFKREIEEVTERDSESWESDYVKEKTEKIKSKKHKSKIVTSFMKSIDQKQNQRMSDLDSDSSFNDQHQEMAQ